MNTPESIEELVTLVCNNIDCPRNRARCALISCNFDVVETIFEIVSDPKGIL
jgi:hypothetical protein